MGLLRDYPFLIIGSGPAGLAAAVSFGSGALVIEKNSCAGRKLLISGQGQCNFTNNLTVNDFLEQCGSAKRFLKTPLFSFDKERVISLLHNNGCPSFSREDGKVFPISLQAADVRDALVRAAKEAQFCYDTKVLEVEKRTDYFLVKTDKGDFTTPKLLISTGGKSYPATGSDGAGYSWARALGHSIKPTKPALTSIRIQNFHHFSQCAGVSLENVGLSFRQEGKTQTEKGDLLFTHKGLSAPLILDNSFAFTVGMELIIHLCDARERVRKLLSDRTGNKMLHNLVKQIPLPDSLAKALLLASDIDPDIRVANLNRVQRIKLQENIINLPLTISVIEGYNRAMLTAGGVDTKEINPKTMESRQIKGLYFAGEIIDYTLPTGGFNIQAALSTGYLVGSSARIETKR